LLDYFNRRTQVIASFAAMTTVATILLRAASVGQVAVFVASAAALAGLAALVGEGTDQLGTRLGHGATGVLQSALGNLPEFFICIFALRAGLVDVVRAALIGSILANTLFVLGLAFILGGLRHGTQRFGAEQTKGIATLLLLAAAAIAIPTIASAPGGPDWGHERDISVVVSVVLLVVFVASVPFSLKQGARASSTTSAAGDSSPSAEAPKRAWPLPVAIGVLVAAGVGSAFVSDWFIEALKPAMSTLGMSEQFAGLVVVAIAGNAVENVVGVQAMLADKADLAISIILNSSLQVALALAPVLVLASLIMGGAALTLVVSPLLAAALALTALLTAFIVVDGESTWLEGTALMGLYIILAASVWWGPPIGG
jgi:Ca2+:H+ antiporter